MSYSTAIPALQRKQFSFTGTAGEYFRIWIVNLCLTLLTLGIYSAWAKVRRKRYFYGNTWLDGSAFEYHARPIAILKGRLIAFGLFVVYGVVSELSQVAGLAAGVAFFAALPWIVTRSLTFNARNSSYRNVRFDFRGQLREAAGAFALGPILIALSLGIMYPWVVRRQKRFIMANHAFGMTQARFAAANARFYAIYLIALGCLAVVALLAGVVAAVAMPQFLTDGLSVRLGVLFTLVAIIVYGASLWVYALVQAGLTNLVWGSVAIGGNAFESRLQAGPLAWIYVTNALGILASVGLLIPWAAVRTAGYRVERLTLVCAEDLDRFVGDTKAKLRSAGEEVAEMFDADISL